MLIDVVLPEVSENVKNATVVKLLVAVGEAVSAEQPLLEVETEKAMFELPSPGAGTVAEILVQPGDQVAVGQVLLRLAPPGGSDEVRKLGSEEGRKAEGAEVRKSGSEEVPALGTRNSELGTFPPLSPSPLQRPAPALGTRLSELGTSPPLSPSPLQRPAAAPALGTRNSELGTFPPLSPPPPPLPAAPSVRRLAREIGVDLHAVRGTGPKGRISAQDVKDHARSLLEAPVTPTGAPAARPLPDFSRWGPVRREPLSTVPRVTQHDKADITELEAFRARHAGRAEASGGKLTVTAVLLKVVAEGLKEFPRFNASIDAAGGEVVLKEYVHVGVAVDTDRGLLVPVVRDADKKSLSQLASDLSALAEKARTKRLMPDEMEGGTFTISNLGGIGGTAFSPIVYWPQVAILGVSRSEMAPVWRDGQFQPRLTLPLSLSYDHRLIDGADGARFLRWVCETLQWPWRLVL